ncbi:tyrosine-protein phosphatase [Streptomyces sp. M19]
MLFRSGHLAHATEADAAFLGSLGLHTIFDFRNAADIRLEGPDVALDGVTNVNLPLSDPADGAGFWRMVRDGDLPTLRELLADGKGAARMVASYRSMVRNRTEEHGRVLRALAEDSVPALMHCAAGKDRAGLTVAVTLLALGVERQAIEADYLESAAAHRRYKVWRSGDPPRPCPRRSWSCSRRCSTPGSSTWTRPSPRSRRTGDTERYLTDGLGLLPAQRERMRARLLTD